MWQPISTAPMDETPVLIFCPDRDSTEGTCYVAWFGTFDIEWWHVEDGKFGPRPVRGPAPTHWMPLPSRPIL